MDFSPGAGKQPGGLRSSSRGIGGTEVGGVFKLPESANASWKDILTRSIEDLIKERGERDDRLLFLWDEMPFMLDEIRKRDGELVAMEVLDVLRSLRQDHPDLRMLVTGSIGIHHVLSALKEADYRGEPLNDLFPIEIEPLGPEHAVELTRQLIDGENLAVEDIDGVVSRIARVADGFPFYIHHLVKTLALRGEKVTSGAVNEAVSHQLMDEDDPWELVHYRTRIDGYYGGGRTRRPAHPGSPGHRPRAECAKRHPRRTQTSKRLRQPRTPARDSQAHGERSLHQTPTHRRLRLPIPSRPALVETRPWTLT